MLPVLFFFKETDRHRFQSAVMFVFLLWCSLTASVVHFFLYLFLSILKFQHFQLYFQVPATMSPSR